jgi:hypothetical protein
MNRLTRVESSSVLIKDGWKKKDTENYTSICYGCEEIRKCVNKCGFYKALEKLTEYEDTGLEPHHIDDIVGQLLGYLDAEQAGLLIELPYKFGDTVYINIQKKTYECKISGFYIIEDEIQFMVAFPDVDNATWFEVGETHKQEDLFLTREEAEKALKEMEVENGEH